MTKQRHSETSLLLPPNSSAPALYSQPPPRLDTQSISPPESPSSPAPPYEPSKTDLAWILAGLWSAVFLGALDGAQSPCNSSVPHLISNASHRHYRRDADDPDRKLFQQVQPGVLHWHILSSLCLLLHASLRYASLVVSNNTMTYMLISS
jgi:hypothetical protein